MKKIQLFLVMLLVSCLTAAAQSLTATGKVTYTDDGAPVIGATVKVKGTTNAVVTDVNGAYKITIPASAAKVLEVSFVGLSTVTIDVPQSGNYDVKMEQDAMNLDEVIVTAFGTSTKRAFTGSASVVSSKSIESRPLTNAAAALEGAGPGIQVNNSYGAPGSEPTIRIRGIGSINASNDPLIVVDGMPYSGGLSTINSDDIANFTVLKDASSTALYGSRAANGVVMITTKKGRQDALTLQFKVNQGIAQRGINEYETVSPEQFYTQMWQSLKNGAVSGKVKGVTPETSGQYATDNLIGASLKYNIYNVANNELVNKDGVFNPSAQMLAGYVNDRDWYSPLMRTGYRGDYSLSASGGSQKADYYTSIGYTKEDGFVKKSGYERFTARANVNIQATPWLKTGVNISGTLSNSSNITGDAGNSSNYLNPFFFARNIAPIYPIHMHDAVTGDFIIDPVTGQQIYDIGSGGASIGANTSTRPQYSGRSVIQEILLDEDNSRRLNLTAQSYVEISFLKDFKFTVKANAENTSLYEASYDNNIVGNGAGTNGRARREQFNYQTVTFQQMLTWNKSFGKHNVDAVIAHESYDYMRNYLYTMKSSQVLDGNSELVNFNVTDSNTSYTDKYRTEGYLARARYNYDNKYYLEASYRRDGSSKFAPESRWGNFWSVGGSWVINSENFMKNAKAVDLLKLRVSYGQVGNDAGIDYYAWQPLYKIIVGGNSGANALYKSSLGNKNLQWESSESFDAALEFGFFGGLTGSVEFFNRQSSNLLFDVPLALSAGPTNLISSVTNVNGPPSPFTTNVGTMYNRGFELSLAYDVVKRGDWLWNVGVNATSYVNKITALPDGNPNGIINGTKKMDVGHGIYDFWLRSWKGVDPTTGSSLYILSEDEYGGNEAKIFSEKDGDVRINGVNYATDHTRARFDWAGSAIPDVYGSLNSALSYKGFELSFMLTFAIGGKVFDSSYASLMSSQASAASNIANLHIDAMNAWQKPGDITDVPRMDYNKTSQLNAQSDRWLIDGSYLNFKSVTLAYAFPKELAKKIHTQSLRLYVSGENLGFINKRQGLDIQQSFTGTSSNSYVAPRMFTIGLNVTF